MTEQIPPTSTTSEAPASPVERAAWLKRFAAYFIDMILLGLVGSCLGIPVGMISALGGPDWLSVLPGILGIAITALYFIWAYSTGGQTLGKRALNIKVVSIDGSPLDWRKGIARTFGYVLSWIPLGLGFLWAIWDADKQAGHDKIAGTCVVPVSVAPEELQGSIEPAEVRRKRRRWLLGLGIPSLLVLGCSVSGFIFFVQKGVAEVRAMGPWPGLDVSASEAVKADLSHLGLQIDQVQDMNEKAESAGSFQDGAMISYHSGGVPVAQITMVQYADKGAAGGAYTSAQAWAQAGNCGLYTTAYWGNSGVIHCQASDAYDKIFWKDYWIVDIVAVEGSGTAPAVLVDQVRDALAAHWKDITPAP